jgi:hypothetical protein
MGQRAVTKIRLRYVQVYVVKGKTFYYFRRPGFKLVRLRGAPGSESFMAAYQEAMAGQPEPLEIGARKTRPGTVNAAVVGYYNSLAFRELAPETQKLRRRILERFRARLDDNGRECGNKSIATLPREAIVRMLANMAPFARQNW